MLHFHRPSACCLHRRSVCAQIRMNTTNRCNQHRNCAFMDYPETASPSYSCHLRSGTSHGHSVQFILIHLPWKGIRSPQWWKVWEEKSLHKSFFGPSKAAFWRLLITIPILCFSSTFDQSVLFISLNIINGRQMFLAVVITHCHQLASDEPLCCLPSMSESVQLCLMSRKKEEEEEEGQWLTWREVSREMCPCSLLSVPETINHMDVIAKCHRTGIPCYGLLFA